MAQPADQVDLRRFDERREPQTWRRKADAFGRLGDITDHMGVHKHAVVAHRADPAFSVVCAVRDEADNILPLMREIFAALGGSGRYEVIFVDDGSVDGTADRLEDAMACGRHVRVLRHRRASGQSNAILSGVRAARGAWVVTIDGDGQNDPADINRLLDVVREPSAPPRLGLVAGVRRRRYDRLSKRLGSRIANAVRRSLLHDGAVDTGCGLKAFRRDTFLALARFDHMHRFLPALMQREDFAVRFVDVGHRPRRAGVSKYGTLDRLFVGIVDLLGVMWLRRRTICVLAEEQERP